MSEARGSSRRLAAVVGAALTLALAGAGTASAGPTQAAPPTTVSADGRTVAGAGMSMSASVTRGLSADGQLVTVAGTGFDETKGIYVTVCVIPPAGTTPSPCGGGQDDANAGSAWISSDPPSYAVGSTTPYGANGSFQVDLAVTPQISPSVDCRQVRCAIVTRNDHTRTSDRGQDLLLPISFAAPATTAPVPAPTPMPGSPDVTPDPTTSIALPSTTTTTIAPQATDFAPAASVSPDGRAVTDGIRTLSITRSDELAPGDFVTVTGSGFDPEVGVYLALCAIPAANQAPDRCSAGADRSTWLSSSPPAYGDGLARAFEEGGTFALDLLVDPVIDRDTDCRTVPCAVTTRRDDTAPDDRTADLFIPVQFGDAPVAPVEAPEEPDEAGAELRAMTPADDDPGGSTPVGILFGGLAVVALAAVTAAATVRARRPRMGDGA